MIDNVEDLTVTYEEGGLVVTKELKKKVLTKGAWATVIYSYQDWSNKDQDYGIIKFTIRRYQKRNGQYFQKSKFNISSVDQAGKIIAALTEWTEELKDAGDEATAAEKD